MNFFEKIFEEAWREKKLLQKEGKEEEALKKLIDLLSASIPFKIRRRIILNLSGAREEDCND